MSEHGRKETTRFIVSSMIGGAVITAVLVITEILVMQHLPYRDVLAYAVVIAVIRGFVKAARQNPVDSK